MPNSPKTEILALLRAHDEAIARGDAAFVIAPMSPDIVSYDLPPPLEYRGDEVRNVAGLEKMVRNVGWASDDGIFGPCRLDRR
jgi:hypothetical protein